MKQTPSKDLPPLQRLKDIVHMLRSPGGCPWDIKQTPQSITPHIIEEAYELVQAIESKDIHAIKDELSDALLHIVMLTEMLSETEDISLDSIAEHCSEKMIRRHPHVFGDTADINTSDDVKAQWEEIKLKESKNKGLLDGIPDQLPALWQAHKIQKKVAQVGFDWPDTTGATEKLVEECQELLQATTDGHIDEEIGDILFTIANICRKEGKHAETLLQNANKKFKERFKQCEAIAKQHNKPLNTCTLTELEAFWHQAKVILQQKTVND